MQIVSISRRFFIVIISMVGDEVSVWTGKKIWAGWLALTVTTTIAAGRSAMKLEWNLGFTRCAIVRSSKLSDDPLILFFRIVRLKRRIGTNGWVSCELKILENKFVTGFKFVENKFRINYNFSRMYVELLKNSLEWINYDKSKFAELHFFSTKIFSNSISSLTNFARLIFFH